MEPSWILDADRIRQILKHPLEWYKRAINATFFDRFEKARDNTKQKTWYSDMMIFDALMYILNILEIIARESNLKVEMKVVALVGEQ